MTDNNETLDQDDAVQAPSAADEAMAEQMEAAARAGAGKDNRPAEQKAEGYSPPQFGHLEHEGEAEVNLDLILDVPVTLSMEVGHTKVPIRNLLQLNQGSVVELDRTAGEPLDVFVNGTLIAHGEVVVVNDKFGVRLLDVVSPSERIRRLKK